MTVRSVRVGERTAYAASGFLGAKHLAAGVLIGLVLVCCGAVAILAGWAVSRGGGEHGFIAIVSLALLGVSVVIGGLIALLGLMLVGASICESLTSHACWVDDGVLYHATTCAGVKRTKTFPASVIDDLGAALQSRVNTDAFYLIELRERGVRLHRPLLTSLREDEAKQRLAAMRADLGLSEAAWAPRQIAQQKPTRPE